MNSTNTNPFYPGNFRVKKDQSGIWLTIPGIFVRLQPGRAVSFFCLFMYLFLSGSHAFSQTTFSEGQIMFTGYASDPAAAPPPYGAFSIVLLTDVQNGTVIYITDRGWSNTTGFRNDTDGEGTISFTFTAAFSCGAELIFSDLNGANDWQAKDANGNIVGTIVIQAGGDVDGMELGTAGDQLFIYQLPEPTSGSQGTFISMIQMDNNFSNPLSSDDESELPAGLGPKNIIRFNTEYDDAKYDCTPNAGQPTGLRAAISNDDGLGGLITDATNNWAESQFFLSLTTACSFCCGYGIPPLTALNEVATSQIFTITVTGTLPPGGSWQLYTAGCGVGSPLQTTTTNVFTVTAPSTTGTITYYVRPSSDPSCTNACSSITVCVVADLTSLCTNCSANMTTCGDCFLPAPFKNPDLDSGCYQIKLIFILDESGSIGGNETDVKNGVLAFLNALNGQDIQAALIEFSSLATVVNTYTTINDNYIANVTNYFNGIPFNGQIYFPNGGTNWHDAMIKADAMATADLILFFTDGEPTVWTMANGQSSDCGGPGSTQPPEIVNPVKLANKLKAEGTHMFMLGVGGGINILNLERMSGFTKYQSGLNTMGTSDYSIGNFATLATELQNFVDELCNTFIQITKTVLGPICQGVVKFRFIVKNLGTESATNYVFVRDTFPSVYTNLGYNGPPVKLCPFVVNPCPVPSPPNGFVWITEPIPPLESDTLIIYATVLGSGPFNSSYNNKVWATTDNADTVSGFFLGSTLLIDQNPTIICPVNITIACSASTLPANTGTASGFDPDGPTPILTYNDVTANGSCPQNKIITRTWKATDACGNTAVCSHVITLTDTAPPVVSCPPSITVDCAANTSPTSVGNPGVTDLCDPSPTVTHTDVIISGACPAEFIIRRTWSATDHCGNNSTCLQTITLDDNTPPSLTCEFRIIGCSESISPENPNLGYPAVTNNCGGTSTLTYSDNFVFMSEPPQCSINRTWTATDNCGNSGTCLQLIVVKDLFIPTIFCPSNVTIACSASTLPGSTGTATATDNCSIAPGLSYTDAITGSPTCVQNYTIARKWKATDECGNSATCIQNITVIDNTVPSLTCPVNVTINCSASTLPANTGTATGADNCSTFAITSNDVVVIGACPQEKVITRTWKNTDACGNLSTCNQIITIHDALPPSLTCPVNVTIQCTASTLPATTGTATATDNCSTFAVTSSDVILPGSCPQQKTITRTWKATDACGNFSTCNQIINVVDTAPPGMTCPVSVTIDCTASTLPAATGNATATDNCSTFTVTSTDIIVTGSCPQEKVITRTWKAMDACGNFSTCNQIITIHDTTAPALTCPSNVTIECTASTLPANTGTSTATDDCSTYAITFTDVFVNGGCPQEKIITRTWKATDACNNFNTCVQVITIDDSQPPVITCPVNKTVECTASTLPANTGAAIATDNCSTISITSTDVVLPGDCPQEHTIIRNWKATDACGNISSCNQTIIVDDSTNPLMTCPANVTIECNVSTLPASTGSATATDNCSTFGITSTDVITGGSCPQASVITRTWKATDACGNSSSCIQTIVIHDTTPPAITCPSDVTVQCTASTLPAQTGTATRTDNCDAAPVLVFNDITISGPGPHGYTILRTWTATDGCGNSSTCLQNVRVDNPLDPGITGDATDTICSGYSEIFMAQNQGLGSVTYLWSFGSGSSPSTATGIGPHTVTYTYNPTNGSVGAWVILTVSFPGCASVTDTVSNIHVNPIPNTDFAVPVPNLCYFKFFSFKPTSPQVPGFYYHWDFGSGASLPPATGYGPYNVKYSTTGVKSVQLIVFANAAGATCGDTNTLSFNVVACPGNVTGKVRDTLGVGIGSVNIKLFQDNNLDGLPDPNIPPTKSVNTVSSGVYSMVSIIPGQYVIVETQPVGYISKSDMDDTNDFDTLMNVNMNDNIIPCTIEASETDADNIFVEKKVNGVITGYVFTDLDNDLVVDNGEGLLGVTITLYNDVNHNGIPVAGNVIATKQTSVIGFYEFGDIPNGDYILVESQPVGYTSSMDIDVSGDNDVVPNSNMMDDIIPVTITLAETDADNYFIEVQVCGNVVTNANDNGPGSFRYVVACVASGDTIIFHPSLANQTIHLNSSRIEINKNLHILSGLTPRVKIKSDIAGAFLIDAGFTVEFKNIDIISGLSGYPGAAFENNGPLIFWDMTIGKNPLLLPNNYLIYNSSAGSLTVKGNILIDNN
ncbi:MAG: SdrD B-like domain-containing protein [Saprospiraceae bacterium]